MLGLLTSVVQFVYCCVPVKSPVLGRVQTSPLHERPRCQRTCPLGGVSGTGAETYVCADMMLRYAMLAPSIMSISPPSGQFGPYSQTADQGFVNQRPSAIPSSVPNIALTCRPCPAD